MQVADHLRRTPGVESVSVAGWALLSGNRWTRSAASRPRRRARQPYFLEVSPGFFETMRIRLIDGRDFDPATFLRACKPGPASAGVGIVNEAFARTYFNGANPVGRAVDVRQSKDLAAPMEIVGYVCDAAYRDLREPSLRRSTCPMGERRHITFLARMPVIPGVGPHSAPRSFPGPFRFRVHAIETQSDFVRSHLVRERLLATLSLFFALVALVLAAVGLYGVLNYSVTRQRRESASVWRSARDRLTWCAG